MTYKHLSKINDLSKIPSKKFIELYGTNNSFEITLEEISGVPLPKPELFSWDKITNREIRAILYDW